MAVIYILYALKLKLDQGAIQFRSLLYYVILFSNNSIHSRYSFVMIEHVLWRLNRNYVET